MTDFEAIGGEQAVDGHVRAFVDRMFDDWIIGFLFAGKDRERIVRHEAEHASRVLGGPTRYTGRPLGATHGPLGINRGQFRRRLAILRTVLAERGVPEEVVGRWLAHDQRLERVITDGTDCAPVDPEDGASR